MFFNSDIRFFSGCTHQEDPESWAGSFHMDSSMHSWFLPKSTNMQVSLIDLSRVYPPLSHWLLEIWNNLLWSWLDQPANKLRFCRILTQNKGVHDNSGDGRSHHEAKGCVDVEIGSESSSHAKGRLNSQANEDDDPATISDKHKNTKTVLEINT